MNGLAHSGNILLVISQPSIALLAEDVNKGRDDNVLEKIVRALQYVAEAKAGVRVIPVLIGESAD